jgi:hypothetical protein
MCLPNFEKHPSETDSMKWDNAALAGSMPGSRVLRSWLVVPIEGVTPEWLTSTIPRTPFLASVTIADYPSKWIADEPAGTRSKAAYVNRWVLPEGVICSSRNSRRSAKPGPSSAASF